MFAGESKDPKAVAEAVKVEIERLKKDGIDKDAFERVRRERYGLSVMAFDSVEGIANNCPPLILPDGGSLTRRRF